MISESKLREYYEELIDIPIYRVVPTCDYKKIVREGIDPKKDPYEKIKHLIFELEKIIIKNEKEGRVLSLRWGEKVVTGSYALGVTLVDFSLDCIDFSSGLSSTDYYMGFKGGAATANLTRIIMKIKEEKFELTKKDRAVINKISKWVKKRTCENVVLRVSGTSKFLESALFQRLGLGKSYELKKGDYWESPFGSFKNFKKVILKHGIKKYKPFLRENFFYLRVRDIVPKEAIKGVHA
jgi:hypothetical protein